jgi:hypothetical protein
VSGNDADKGWWAVVVRIASEVDDGDRSLEEYSLRLVRAVEVESAKLKACAAAARPNSLTTDGLQLRHRVVSVVGAEYLGEEPPGDGAELWSRLSFLERDEDRGQEGKPPHWAIRAFHTNWSVDTPEEQI